MTISRTISSGFSLVELCVASAILAFALAGIFEFYLFGILMQRTADDSAVANKNLVQRMNQIRRTPGWGNVTSPSYISTLLSSPITATTANLSGMTQESVTISAASLPYASPTPASTPSPTPAPVPFTATRSVGTSGTTVAINPASATPLSAAAAVNVTLNIQWQDRSGRTHTRELSTILSNGGITR